MAYRNYSTVQEIVSICGAACHGMRFCVVNDCKDEMVRICFTH
jgi:hypothetical protein